MSNNWVKGLIALTAVLLICLFGLMFGYAYIDGGIVGVFQVDTWQNFFYQLRNFLS